VRVETERGSYTGRRDENVVLYAIIRQSGPVVMTVPQARRAATREPAGDPDERVYPVAKVAAIVAGLVAEGVSPSKALARVDLTADEIASPQTRVSLNQTMVCCRNATRLSRDPMFAFHTGLRFHVSAQGMYGFAILSSSDYRKAIAFAITYHRLATPLATIEFREEGGHGIWSVRPAPYPGVDATMYRFLTEMQFGIHIAMHRDVMGSDFRPQEIHLTYGTAADAVEWRKLFGCDVRCAQPENRLIFDAKWLDQIPPLGHDIAHAGVLSVCDAMLDDLQLRAGIAGKVRETLLVRPAASWNVADVARRLRMSQRTLRRRLKSEGMSFRQLFGEVRARIAIGYLRNTDLPLGDVAAALGFSDESGFRTAFRRWTGQGPREYRRRYLAETSR
jgi:AraC-like DNA-binding protein